MKIIKLSPSDRKIGLSIRALRVEQDRADWQTYSENSGRPQATLADHFRIQQREEGED
jgi:ribosomal protein S1